MLHFEGLAPAGAVVIAAIVILFILAVILLLFVYTRYRLLHADVTRRGNGAFTSSLREDFRLAYRQHGQNTNTPAIIDNAIASRLGGLLFCERFMNNAVSLFVTLGLFGTFLGLSLSVSSLTELLSLSSSEEWLSILDSVGGGLISALSGMGVAFYTSLVGVACSIVFTLLRSVFSPQVQRERLETAAELWLDHAVAPQETAPAALDGASGPLGLDDALRGHAAAVENALNACTARMEQVLSSTTASLGDMIAYSKEPIAAFYETVRTFNENVRDFSEFNYDLRGNIERMDVTLRDLSAALRQAGRAADAQPRESAVRRGEAQEGADSGGAGRCATTRDANGGRRQ